MPAPQRVKLLLALVSVLSAAVARPSAAQMGASVPPASHDLAVESLYSGDYRRAERGFESDLRGSVKIGLTQWIDAIASSTMLGETLYQQGRNAEALAQFDHACQVYLAYPDWLRRVSFRQAPRPDANTARRATPWRAGARQATYASLPETMLMSFGRIDNTQQAEQGGLVQQAQFWRVDVVEIVRCTALAIRRRQELLGPLAPSDRLTKEMVAALSRGGLGPANHWSNAWVELQLGLALVAIGKDTQATQHLNRAVLLDGRFDHSLTGAALLAQADIAKRAGATPVASRLYAEAATAAFAFGDLDVMGEALQKGATLHLASGAPGGYPPLEAALAWADRQNLDHLDWLLRHALVEGLTRQRQTARAVALLDAVSTRRRDLSRGRLGVARDWLIAVVRLQQGNQEQADEAIAATLDRQAAIELRNFQTGLANDRFDSGRLSPRLAVDVYRRLLSDPTSDDWASNPFGAIAHLRTDHQAAFGRWFGASIGRSEFANALEISDLAKRRRFFARQPLAGRLVAIRRLLETPAATLGKLERLQQQALLARFPAYAGLSDDGAAARRELLGADALVDGDRLTTEADRALKKWSRVSEQREAILMEMALTRTAASLGFPTTRTAAETQQRLRDGDAMVVFHRSGAELHGFTVVGSDIHHWRVGGVRATTRAVADTLQAFGNFGRGRGLSADAATGDTWEQPARELGAALLGGSRLDLSEVARLIFVPDGPVWHAPFEAILLAADGSGRSLLDVAPIRYAPTVGLAFAVDETLRPVRRTGLALQRVVGSNLERAALEQQHEQLAAALARTVRLPTPSAAPSPLVAATVDQLIVDIPTEIEPGGAYDWSPAPVDRVAARGRLGEWLTLPAAAPDRLVLSGVHTVAEKGLKTSRRSSASTRSAPGDELFHATCGLLAAGSRTVLMTRWATDGAIHGELVREFAAQMDKRPAEEAWRRSVRLARAAAIDPQMEPRLDWSETDGEPPTAEHPFFWAGYLLIDSGVDPAPDPPEEEAGEGGQDAAEPAQDNAEPAQDAAAADPAAAAAGP